MKPQISVIIPIFNELKTIEKLLTRLRDSLESIEKSFELIFVDDGSTDGSSEYIESYRRSGNIILLKKKGRKGKSFSLIEGFARAKGEILVMIDGDLQYPPEEIPKMIEKLDSADVVVADRKIYRGGKMRKFFSRSFRYAFGKVGFGLTADVQSGLKVFRKDAYIATQFLPKTPWSFDLEFLHRANQMGYKITGHEISFEPRINGDSKISLFSASFEIGLNALLLKLKRLGPLHIPSSPGSMQGAGIGYEKRKYITHTTLYHKKSALRTFTLSHKLFFGLMAAVVVFGVVKDPYLLAVILVGILSFIYFLDVLFNLFLISRSLKEDREIVADPKELALMVEKELPLYSILCPLYREARVIPQFLRAIEKLDYPKNKLEVLLLLEEDDRETVSAVSQMDLPSYVKVVVVPDSNPKTKPKACNYGLSIAKGEFLVIYDAEDVPDPLQLKKSIYAFKRLPKDVICLQAKLNYYNPHQNVLTRFFTAEYSLWFDVILTGLQSLDTLIPLGGTSNHFRTKDLRSLQGWDPFNVTEDADLGIRLFNTGYKTAIIDSTTLEEANSSVGNWVRQRSRWIKGYMQTYLVHTRGTFGFDRKKGHHSLILHLVVGGKIAFILINPLLWIATFSYFALYSLVGPTIESLYPPLVFYMAVTSLVFGNFLFLYYYMIGAYKKEQYGVIKYIFFIPLYWLLLSVAGAMALYQLVFKPHYWEKTVHGLHLNPAAQKKAAEVIVAVEEEEAHVPFPTPERNSIIDRLRARPAFTGGFALVVASVAGNVLNLIFSTYFGRVLSPSDFGTLSLVRSFWFTSNIPMQAGGTTANFRSGFLDTRFDSSAAHVFWSYVRSRSFVVSTFLTIAWMLAAPILANYFNAESILPFLLFAPIWFFGFAYYIDHGYLSGRMLFWGLAFIAVVEALLKLAVGLVIFRFDPSLVYVAIPLSFVLSFFLGWVIVATRKHRKKVTTNPDEVKHFPKKFFGVSLLSGLSMISFLSLDVMLAKHYLSPTDAGYYGLLSLVGSMVLFTGTLATQFIVPLVSREEGARKKSRRTLYVILGATTLLSGASFVLFGILGEYVLTLPFLLGESIEPVLSLVPFFAFAVYIFILSRVFVTYYLARRVFTFPVVAFLLSILQFALIQRYHSGIESFVIVALVIGGAHFVSMVVLHIFVEKVKVFEDNLADLLAVFTTPVPKENSQKLRILILNWRDKRHVWAGGAEVYVQELAKRWVKKGCQVTIFCGNDTKSPKNQNVDGVDIKRRGGTYTVYFWAFVYYIFRFRGKYDVIIDCENGIPFFSPFYSRKSIFLLIHHVHQEVFQEHLRFPASVLASFLEGKLMPFVYKDKQIVTVSESSKQAIVRLGIAKANNITIVQNGINSESFIKLSKADYPLFVYLGRLKAYKNIHVALYAFARLLKDHPQAQLDIVGSGEMGGKLYKLAKKLGIEHKVTFYGQVSEKLKAEILGRAWACLQPSMMEGFGITVIEANAAGTPVIAANVPGLRDAVVHGKTGYLVEVGNDVKMYKAMVQIAENKSVREKFSREAQAWAKTFDWDRSATEFMRLMISSLDAKYRSAIRSTLALSKEYYE